MSLKTKATSLPTNEAVMSETSPVSPMQQRSTFPTPISMSPSAKCDSRSRQGNDKGLTMNNLALAEGVGVAVAEPAVTVALPGPRDPHTFVSKRIIQRRSTSVHAQGPSQLQPTTEGSRLSPAADRSLSFLRSPKSLDQQLNNSLTSVTDECVMAILSCRDDPLLYSCSRRGTETSAQVSPRNMDIFESIPMASTTTPPSSHRVSCDYLVAPLLLLSRKQNPSQSSSTHTLSLALADGTHCSPRVIKNTADGRRKSIIGPPRVVTRGERERPEVKQQGESVDGITNAQCSRSSREMVEDFCASRRTSSPAILMDIPNDVVAWPCPPSVGFAEKCPDTPLSVTEELMNDVDDISNSHFLQNIRQLPTTKEKDAPQPTLVKLPEPPSARNKRQPLSTNTQADRTREGPHAPQNALGGISGVRIVCRNTEKGM